jgi:hypothetical protein
MCMESAWQWMAVSGIEGGVGGVRGRWCGGGLKEEARGKGVAERSSRHAHGSAQPVVQAIDTVSDIVGSSTGRVWRVLHKRNLGEIGSKHWLPPFAHRVANYNDGRETTACTWRELGTRRAHVKRWRVSPPTAVGDTVGTVPIDNALGVGWAAHLRGG